jgi:glycosyltransferase involved in cell wall biosynthesis
MESDIVRLSDKNVFISQYSLKQYEKHLVKVPRSKLEVIPLPYNPVFLKSSKPNKPKKLKIGFFARWDKVKNHEAYLALARTAKEMGLDWEFYTLAQIGESYTFYQHIYHEYVKRIKILKPVTADRMPAMYAKMDVLVLPSKFETFSGVVMESLMQNRPILVSPGVALAQTLKRNGLGKWVDKFDNPKATLRKIEWLSRQKVPASLRKQLIKENSPKRIFDRYHKLLKEAIKQ